MQFIELIEAHWQIIVAVVGIVSVWANQRAIVKDHGKRITILEEHFEDINPVFLDIKERLASIEATLQFLVDKK